MSARDDGGPAYPRDHRHDGHNGKTLLDDFAGQALQGWLASWTPSEGVLAPESLARSCYDIAAAMIAERNRRRSA